MAELIRIQYVIIFIAGAGVSVLYHAGLWYTVRALPRSRSPVMLMMSSFYIRAGGALVTFYLVMQDDWRRLLVCVLGFTAVKFLITGLAGPKRGRAN